MPKESGIPRVWNKRAAENRSESRGGSHCVSSVESSVIDPLREQVRELFSCLFWELVEAKQVRHGL